MEYADTDSGENTKRRVQGWTTGQEEVVVGPLRRLAGCRSSFPLQSGKDWAPERSHDHQATFSQTFMGASCFQGFVGGRGFSALPPPPCQLLRRDVHYIPLHDKCIFHIKCNTEIFVLFFTLLPRSEKAVLRLPPRCFLSALDACNVVVLIHCSYIWHRKVSTWEPAALCQQLATWSTQTLGVSGLISFRFHRSTITTKAKKQNKRNTK